MADAPAREAVPTLRERVGLALRALRGESSRAVIPLTLPNFPAIPGNGLGTAQMTLVRTANPQEYKPDGAAVRTEGFTRHPVVHACLRVITDITASVPLVAMTARGDRESRVPESHPLQRLLDTPGPRFSARSMRVRLALDTLAYGNALLEIDRGGSDRGLPRALGPINPESLQSVWVDADGNPARYDYGNWSGIIVTRRAEDIVHVRDIELGRPYQPEVFGFPRGATALGSIAADNEATKYVRQVVTNDGTPTFAVMLEAEATQDDATAMQERYKARVVDRGKRGTPAFFGAVRDIKPLGFTLRDLEFPDLRRVSREDICAAFGVDPRMIGIASAANDGGLSGAQYVEARARLVQHTIEPLMSTIEDELNHWLAPEFGNVWIAFDHDVLRDIVENDETTSTRVRAEFKDGLRTLEEARRALKLSPTPEPMETMAITAGTTLVPAALAVIDPRTAPAATPPVAPPEAPSAEPINTDDEDEDDDELEADRAARSVSAHSPTLSAAPAVAGAAVGGAAPAAAVAPVRDVSPLVDEQGRPWWVHHPEVLDRPRFRDDGEPDEEHILYRYWVRQMQEMDRQERPFYETAIARFKADSADVGRMFAAVERTAERTVRAADPILDEIERRIADNYRPGGEYHAAWREAYLSLIETVYLLGARDVMGVGYSFGMRSPEVLAAIEARATRLATLIGETTSKQVLAAIRASELGGFSYAETARLIRQTVYGEPMTTSRAMRIARTETNGAMSQGSWDQARSEGDLFRSKEWLAFEDRRTRPTHSMAMGQGIIGMDERFANGLLYPLDPAGSAAEVVNCFPGFVPVEGKVVGGLKAHYTGQVREIVTHGGNRLTVTPNHPVLTPNGWVAAGKLEKGHRLFTNRRQVEAVALGVVGDDQQNGPAGIEQVFDTLAADRGVRLLRVAQLHLNGDETSIAGGVDVVRPYGELKAQAARGVGQLVEDFDLGTSEPGESFAERLSALDENLQRVALAAPSSMGLANLTPDALGVALDVLPLETLRVGPSAHGYPVFAQPSKEDGAVIPCFVAELLEAHAGYIAPDQIVEIRDVEFSGHVYDVESVDGWILAGGIVTSNCRCTLVYYTDLPPGAEESL